MLGSVAADLTCPLLLFHDARPVEPEYFVALRGLLPYLCKNPVDESNKEPILSFC